MKIDVLHVFCYAILFGCDLLVWCLKRMANLVWAQSTIIDWHAKQTQTSIKAFLFFIKLKALKLMFLKISKQVILHIK